jgi:hypothetical protein
MTFLRWIVNPLRRRSEIREEAIRAWRSEALVTKSETAGPASENGVTKRQSAYFPP